MAASVPGVTSRMPNEPSLRSRRCTSLGGAPAARFLRVGTVAVVVALAAATAAAAASAQPRTLESPRPAEIAVAERPVNDTTLPAASVQRLAAQSGYWGGAYTTSTGETITIYVSSAYPEDPAMGQKWADYFASLVHGSELSTLVVYLVTPSDVRSICGLGAVACYGGRGNTLVAPGEDPGGGLSLEAVLAHEYGHHVAASRSNPPWDALEYGPKRWASYEGVCASTRAGRIFPGAEDAEHYELNPGEAFAETYRLLNERKAGVAESPWQIVSNVFYPDAGALAATEQDVVAPWTALQTRSYSATLSKKASARAYTVATPLDGTFQLSLRAAAGSRVAVTVSSASSTTQLARGSGRSVSLQTGICGQRSVKLRVSRVAGAGRFSLTVATP